MSSYLELEGLSEEEKQVALKLLSEINSGNEQVYQEFKFSEYKEVPVDIITFIKDDLYLGKAWHLPDGTCKLFPYWEKKLKELFPDNLSTSCNTLILSGARGLGKSEIAITCGLYIMYRLMCLKDPHLSLNLKKTEQVAFSFMNIKLALAEEIGISKFQNTVQLSPWFMKNGTISGRVEKVWNPPDFITIIVGSQASDVIGQGILYCLTGDTEILTDKGNQKLEDVVNQPITVVSLNEAGNPTVSNVCTVKQTIETYDYYEIELQDGSVVKCTPEHKFQLADGTYKCAKELTEHDELKEPNDYYGYVYKTTNLVNSKVYIGQHKGTYFDNSYRGSGHMLQKAIKKYGANNFTVELLEWAISKKDLDKKEISNIKLYNSTNNLIGYNIASGGQGGDLGPVIRKKISNSLLGHTTSDKTRQKMSQSLKGKNIGRKLSPEHIRIISETAKNRVWTTEQRKAISNKNKGRESFIKGKIAITDGKITKYVSPDVKLEDGWRIGNCNTKGPHNWMRYYCSAEMQKNKKASHTGCKNSMWGNGYRVAGGKNGKATKRYFYEGLKFECRKDLVKYLNSISIHISANAIDNITANTYGACTAKKFPQVINELTWEFKNEDK